MLQTINCQLIFALIYCAYVAGNILYYICIYIYLYSNSPFSRHSVNVKCGNRWENMLGLGLLSLSSPSPYQTNHKNRILFRLFLSLFLSFFLCCVFYASCSAFIDSRASNGAACFHFNYGASLGRLKCEYIHQTLCWEGEERCWGRGRGACTHVMPGAI